MEYYTALMITALVYITAVSTEPCRPAPKIQLRGCRWLTIESETTPCPHFRLICDSPTKKACYELPPVSCARRVSSAASLYHFFDVYTGECTRVPVGQCLGRTNRFLSQTHCERTCRSALDAFAATTLRPSIIGTDSCLWIRCSQCHRCVDGRCVSDDQQTGCGGEDTIDVCSRVRCGQCQQCVSSGNEAKCVPRPGCTVDKEECTERLVNCLVSPCLDWKTRCPAAHSCAANYCGGCNAFYYDRFRNRIDIDDCNEKPKEILPEDPCNLMDCQPDHHCVLKSGEGVCVSDRERLETCSALVVVGNCEGSMRRFHYDRSDGKCHEFRYGGCGGNANNFRTMEECQRACRDVELCYIPPIARPPTGCHYDKEVDPVSLCPTYVLNCSPTTAPPCPEKGEPIRAGCEILATGQRLPNGCPIYEQRCNDACLSSPCDPCQLCESVQNARGYYCKATDVRCSERPNCFTDRSMCASGTECKMVTGRPACVPVTDSDRDGVVPPARCLLPKVTGRCLAYFRVFYYDDATKTCQMFIYGGCEGNGNRFATRAECEKTCLVTGAGAIRTTNVCQPNPCATGKICTPEPKQCFTTPCPQYRCSDDTTVGSCPRLEPGTVGHCAEMCSGDDSCAPGYKCCSNGCGHVCTRQVVG